MCQQKVFYGTFKFSVMMNQAFYIGGKIMQTLMQVYTIYQLPTHPASIKVPTHLTYWTNK